MSDPTEDLVSDETREAAAREARMRGRPDRPLTEEEARLAEEHDEVDETTVRAYERALRTGAQVEGEGRVD